MRKHPAVVNCTWTMRRVETKRMPKLGDPEKSMNGRLANAPVGPRIKGICSAGAPGVIRAGR